MVTAVVVRGAPGAGLRDASIRDALVDRAEFLEAVKRSHVRVTEDIVVEQAAVTAVAKCVVSIEQPDGTWEPYRNTRLFTRADASR